MEYHEFEVPSALAAYFQCVWRLRDPNPDAAPQTIYPDGRCELIVHIGTPMRRYTLAEGWQIQSDCLFAGQIRGAIRLAAAGPVDCIGLRLQPAAGRLIAGLRLAELADEIVPLATLEPAFAVALRDAVRRFASSADAAPLWPPLQSRIATAPLDGRVQAACAELDAAEGAIAIDDLARRLHMSVRNLQICFLRDVGITPKEYARIRRLNATVRQLDAGAATLSEVAQVSGYADQAHATRELRRAVGLTPARLRRALRAERDGESTLRMAAAFVRGHATPRPARE